ncbi:MAG: type II toxin-antitoxin system RelE/ParE family toxin [Rhodobacteraceae bacterium]|nr:type II toxin-antitoxin system RelE/ParE family toxin [Paracoccaceae bacterium]
MKLSKASASENFWKYRVGDYRILATIEERTRIILIVRIAH